MAKKMTKEQKSAYAKYLAWKKKMGPKRVTAYFKQEG